MYISASEEGGFKSILRYETWKVASKVQDYRIVCVWVVLTSNYEKKWGFSLSSWLTKSIILIIKEVLLDDLHNRE